jgi:hypothetical protein
MCWRISRWRELDRLGSFSHLLGLELAALEPVSRAAQHLFEAG